MSPDRIDELTEAHATDVFRLYHDLLSLPNDASLPDDIRLNGWLEARFDERGFTVERLDMPGS